MAKPAIEYLKSEGIKNEIVFQSKEKRIWLSDLLDLYADVKIREAFTAYRRGSEIIVDEY